MSVKADTLDGQKSICIQVAGINDVEPGGTKHSITFVYDSNMSQIPMSNPLQYLSHDEILVKLHESDSKAYTY